MTKEPTNLAASIHRRLLDGARARGEDFQLTLLRYGAERLLTFTRRGTDAALVADVLGEEFYTDAVLAMRWRAFSRSLPDSLQRPRALSLSDIGRELRRFLGPLATAMAGGAPLQAWTNESGWTLAAGEG